MYLCTDVRKQENSLYDIQEDIYVCKHIFATNKALYYHLKALYKDDWLF